MAHANSTAIRAMPPITILNNERPDRRFFDGAGITCPCARRADCHLGQAKCSPPRQRVHCSVGSMEVGAPNA